MERNGNPWNLSPRDRMKWVGDIEVPTVDDDPTFELLWWVGCAPSSTTHGRRRRRVPLPTVLWSGSMAWTRDGNVRESGATTILFFPGYSNPVNVIVDATNTNSESDENNNCLPEMVPVPIYRRHVQPPRPRRHLPLPRSSHKVS